MFFLKEILNIIFNKKFSFNIMVGKFSVKKFSTYNAYQSYITNENTTKPNISFCEENNKVYCTTPSGFLFEFLYNSLIGLHINTNNGISLKFFNTNTNYQTYINNVNVIKPNISFVKDTERVYWLTTNSNINLPLDPHYNVTFTNYSNLNLDGSYIKGTTITLPTVTKPADNDYIYNFNGWHVNGDNSYILRENTIYTINSNTVFEASFTRIKNQVNVTLSLSYGTTNNQLT